MPKSTTIKVGDRVAKGGYPGVVISVRDGMADVRLSSGDVCVDLASLRAIRSRQPRAEIAEIAYHYRGGVERGARYAWREGYSRTDEDGGVFYPWMTRRECRADAATLGGRAVFYRDGRRIR